ncbi:hypothetical protein OsI_37813 [Oryza sativa Indica Group]|uniref:3-deoxy-8-phosphooctulonate synthase n=1 Tax=Oryza sativa subsp. indica TaxID=39946 RepID=B8BNM7_ORYSI|nr:hypothetical protein OsI_37813 [Oryza sativa Indica Group]
MTTLATGHWDWEEKGGKTQGGRAPTPPPPCAATAEIGGKNQGRGFLRQRRSLYPTPLPFLFNLDHLVGLKLKAAQPFFLLAGPNVIESEEHVLKMGKHIKGITTKLQVHSFQNLVVYPILEKVKATYDLPVVTDVHESHQTDLLVAAAKTGKIINIKKGQFCAPSVMVNSAEKIRLAGNQNVMVYDLIVDPRNFEWLREANCPVVADVTHALQQPAGKKVLQCGGLRELIPCIARTSVAVGVDGIFMEVHDDPLNAPCDGPTQWPLRNLEELLEELIAIARVTKGKKPLKIDLTPFKE